MADFLTLKMLPVTSNFLSYTTCIRGLTEELVIFESLTVISKNP